MKKSLLTLSAALCAGLTATAGTQELISDTYAMGISPNGLWGASSFYNVVSVVNLSTGEVNYLDVEGDTGNGNNMANNGTLVMSVQDQAYIVVNGEGREFDPTLTETYTLTWLHGITPDATRIVGSYSPAQSRGEMTTFPALWEVDADGYPTKMVELPYPTVDFTGRMPQGCNAIVISADGKTIVGHLVDYLGAYVQPIVYTEGEDGEWSYSLPANELLNPDHLVPPEDPGEYPDWVNPEDFMSEEEAAEYNEAMEEYYATWDEDLRPNPVEYMTEEELEEYNAAVEAYDAAVAEWEAKTPAFNEFMDKIAETATSFIFNDMLLSPDGKTVAAGAQNVEGISFWDRTVSNYTILIDIASGEITKLPDTLSVYPNQLLDNGVILGVNGTAMGATPPQAYIKLPDNEDYIPFEQYLAATNTEAYDWVIENLTKTIELYDMETWEEYEEDFLFTGIVWMSDDQKTFFGGVQSFYWEEDEDPSEQGCCSYLITDRELGGVSKLPVNGKDIKVSATRGGIINIAGDATGVTVYDLTGRVMFSAPAAASVATGLSNGAYIVKVDSANGTKTVKVAF